jgi:hypothetical protein
MTPAELERVKANLKARGAYHPKPKKQKKREGDAEGSVADVAVEKGKEPTE